MNKIFKTIAMGIVLFIMLVFLCACPASSTSTNGEVKIEATDSTLNTADTTVIDTTSVDTIK